MHRKVPAVAESALAFGRKPAEDALLDNPSILSHVSIGTDDLQRSAQFYDTVLATIGARRIMDVGEDAIAWGREWPEFWVNRPLDQRPSAPGNGTHIAFHATSRGQVDAFYRAAIAAGATDCGAPGPRPEYGAPYYGCFVRDLDGHKIEASFWDAEFESEED